MRKQDWPSMKLANWSAVAPLSHRAVTPIRRWCWASDHSGQMAVMLMEVSPGASLLACELLGGRLCCQHPWL